MLLAAYHELVSFKDDVWFHIFCYAEASPAHTWSETMVDKEWDTYHEAGAHGDNLWNMGREYCESEGEETEFTRWVMGNMNADWINHRPVPTPSAAIRVTVGRPYRNVSEELASCLWVNRSMEEVFPEAYDGVESKAEMAELIEAALGTATDTTMFDGIITLWTVCESQ